MTKANYVVIAKALTELINTGCVKKKDINKAIKLTSDRLWAENYKFCYATFENYVKGGIQ